MRASFKFPSMAATSFPLCHNLHTSPSAVMPNLQSMQPVVSLRGLCKQGSLKEAFSSFTALLTHHRSSLLANPDEVFAPLLELCATRKASSQGRQIHAHVLKSGVTTSDPAFLGTKLVFMYGKCGYACDSHQVFDEMPERTVFTWNAIMGACVSNGQPLEALRLYKEMRVFGSCPDSCTFPCALKACGAVGNLRYGVEVHGLAIKCGCASVPFVANAVVAMYAKCKDLDSARKLFDRVNGRDDDVLWNSMISAYSENLQYSEALEILREMRVVGVSPSTYTFVAALQACQDSSSKLGKEIHAATLRSNHFPDVYVANALIAMYVRQGMMVEAARVFSKVDGKDNITWNSLLNGFIQNGLFAEALKFFHDLLDSGIKPDEVSLTSIIGACGRFGYLLNGKETHAYAIRMGFSSHLHVGNTIIDLYNKCSYVSYMGRAFKMMPDKDIISWTTIVAGYAQNSSHLEALELTRQAQVEGMCADAMMIGSILLACSGLKCFSKVKEVHGYMIRHSLTDHELRNTLIDVYGACGQLDYATRVFELLDDKDVISWTSMMSSCVSNGHTDKALEVFRLMRETGVQPDSITLVSLLSAVANLSCLNKGKEIHGFITRKTFLLEDSMANSLVDMYARCGSLENACKVFSCIRNKSLVTWTTMINAYGMHGKGKEAVELFSRMEDQKLIPDHITFLTLLYACSHSGLIDEGKRFLELMKYKYQLEPWQEHYACLVDLLGRANRLEEAFQFVTGMEIEPEPEVWCALLAACQVHSNKELGEKVAQKLLESNTENPGNYVLVSNLFAAESRWKDVRAVRMRMKAGGLKKSPGCSWMEVGNKIHTFIARDKSHPDSRKIYEKLAHITEKLESEGGYVAQTNLVLHNVGEQEKVQILHGHSERLAIAYGLLSTAEGTPIRITKNLRICDDCHAFCRLVSKFFDHILVIRDASRFHHFQDGVCSCADFW
ncbi:Pentatricopeptide repeat-containing protein At3g63370, chloroplastic [Linum grandiflorum]